MIKLEGWRFLLLGASKLGCWCILSVEDEKTRGLELVNQGVGEDKSWGWSLLSVVGILEVGSSCSCNIQDI